MCRPLIAVNQETLAQGQQAVRSLPTFRCPLPLMSLPHQNTLTSDSHLSSEQNVDRQKALALFYGTAFKIAKKQFLCDPKIEFNVLTSILSAQGMTMSSLHQLGAFVHLAPMLVDLANQSTPTPCSNEHTAICHETLSRVLLMMNNFTVLDAIHASLLGDLDSRDKFGYFQLWQAVECSPYMRPDDGSYDAKPSLTSIIASLKPNLLAMVRVCAQHENMTWLLEQHEHMQGFLPVAKSLIARFCATYGTGNEQCTKPARTKLGLSQFIAIFEHTQVQPEAFVQTELWANTVESLKLEAMHDLVDTDAILRGMSVLSRQANFYNLLCIQEGDNMQCLRLLDIILREEVGTKEQAYNSAYAQPGSKNMLLSLVMHHCTQLHLSDRFMAVHHLDVWDNLDWHHHHKGSAFFLVSQHYSQLAEKIAKEDQEAADKQARLMRVNEVTARFRCIHCKAKIPADSLVCPSCLAEGEVKCMMCNTGLHSVMEIKARLCSADLAIALLDDEPAAPVPIMGNCAICNSNFPHDDPTQQLCSDCIAVINESSMTCFQTQFPLPKCT